MLPAAIYPDREILDRPKTASGVSRSWATQSPGNGIDGASRERFNLKQAIREWGEVHYAPVDVAVLDPPEVCDRCGRPIAIDDALDYVDSEDGGLAIVHECCPVSD